MTGLTGYSTALNDQLFDSNADDFEYFENEKEAKARQTNVIVGGLKTKQQ